MPSEKHRLTFISYSRANEDFALRLAKELKAAGFNIWLDQLDIPAGARWDDALENALDACEIFMVIITPASISSENVKDEIGYAIDHQKRILPVLLEETKTPLRLRRFQWVDFTSKSYDEGVEAAKRLLGNLTNQPTIPRPTPSPVAKSPEEQKEKASATKKTASQATADKAQKEQLEAERKKAAKIEAEKAEAERKESAKIEAEKAEAERKEATRIANEKAETDRKEKERIASEKEERERKAKAAIPPASNKAPVEKPPLQELLKNPKVMYGGIGIIVILFIVILASSLGGGGNTPATETPLPTKTEAPTQTIVPSKTATATLAPPTPTSPPTATPTFAPPVTPYVRIIEITIDDSNKYVVEYETFGYTETLPGMHIHFFFDTVPQEQAGLPGSGPWKIYGGPSPFSEAVVANRPAGAKQMCALVANENHTIQLESGNCVDLP